MLRGEVGARAVGPDDGVAREDAALAVVAGDVVALARAGLRECGRRGEEGDRDRQRRECFCLIGCSCRPLGLVGRAAQISRRGARIRVHRRRVPSPRLSRRSRLAKADRGGSGWGLVGSVHEIRRKFNGLTEIRPQPPPPACKNPLRPFKRGHPERWPSGLRRTLGKRVCGKLYRGFESHSLRQYIVLHCSPSFGTHS